MSTQNIPERLETARNRHKDVSEFPQRKSETGDVGPTTPQPILATRWIAFPLLPTEDMIQIINADTYRALLGVIPQQPVRTEPEIRNDALEEAANLVEHRHDNGRSRLARLEAKEAADAIRTIMTQGTKNVLLP